jgi:hypothetical protein
MANHIETSGAGQAKDCASLFRFPAFSGLRIDEARHVVWNDMDFKKELLHARITKNGKDHWIPLNSSLRQLLEKMRAERPKAVCFSTLNDLQRRRAVKGGVGLLQPWPDGFFGDQFFQRFKNAFQFRQSPPGRGAGLPSSRPMGDCARRKARPLWKQEEGIELNPKDVAGHELTLLPAKVRLCFTDREALQDRPPAATKSWTGKRWIAR